MDPQVRCQIRLIEHPAVEIPAKTVDQQQVAEWNRFVDDLYNLHKRQLEGKAIRTEERIDGYHQMPEFYREVMYYDASNGRLLSRVAWERENPDRLHEIEVFQHDTEGRVILDTTTFERAELKQEQIHAFGTDWRVSECVGSMSAVIEPEPA